MPYYHPRTEQRTPSPAYATEIGRLPEASLCDREFIRGLVLSSRVFPEDIVVMARRVLPKHVFPYMKNSRTIRLSYLSERIARIADNISRDILFPPPLPLYKYQTSRRSASNPPVPDARRSDVMIALD
ncbi:hypothetical protein F511_03334 [Dorcoceras hygrometricum]|uniref:Uncharacterized protein n=1 Tax=Dorcoceras hygrometricum TaxID=472368 RepID=A0A2Z7BLU4_9LAMI|nr:hypothetical protein F511_03334 [Dorcoceras hygrometricum]